MRRITLAIQLFGLVCWLFAAASAQTTISIVQAESMLSAGYTQIPDSVATKLYIGSPGSNLLWDFSSLQANIPIPLHSVPVAGTPFGTRRAGSTNALTGIASISYSGIAVVVPVWRYYAYTKSLGGASAILASLGDMAAGPIPSFGDGLGAWVNSQPDTLFSLPVTYQATWKSSYTDTTFVQVTNAFIGTFFIIPLTTRTHKVTYTVDAFGAMKMPGGSTAQALRIKRVDTTSSGVDLKYIFVSDRFARVEVSAKSADQPPGDSIEVSSPTWWNVDVPTAVNSDGRIPAVYSLSQNFPNPFNPSTTIRFGLPERSTVTLKVYSLIGEEVATVLNGNLEAGEHTVEFNAGGLASGIYFYKLQAGPTVQIRKMVILK